MQAYVRATVYYTCEIIDEDAEKVRKYAEENDCELAEAIATLYRNGNEDESIKLYEYSYESDFSTEEIEDAWEEDERGNRI